MTPAMKVFTRRRIRKHGYCLMARPRSPSRGDRRPVPVAHQPFPAAATPAPLATHPCSPWCPPHGLVAPALLWAFPPSPSKAPDLDLDRALATPPPPPPGRPAWDPREVSVVPETPPELLLAASRPAVTAHASAFNAASGGQGTHFISGSWADRVRGGGGHAHDAHSPRMVAAGLETKGAGGWVTVASRRPRRPEFPAAPTRP